MASNGWRCRQRKNIYIVIIIVLHLMNSENGSVLVQSEAQSHTVSRRPLPHHTFLEASVCACARSLASTSAGDIATLLEEA